MNPFSKAFLIPALPSSFHSDFSSQRSEITPQDDFAIPLPSTFAEGMAVAVT